MTAHFDANEKREMIIVSTYTKMLDEPRAGVRCIHRHGRREYVLAPEAGEPIIVARAGAWVVLLDDKDKVLTREGEVIKATYRFYRTVETIDPYHIVFDMP